MDHAQVQAGLTLKQGGLFRTIPEIDKFNKICDSDSCCMILYVNKQGHKCEGIFLIYSIRAFSRNWIVEYILGWSLAGGQAIFFD